MGLPKHIDIKYYVVKKKIQDHTIEIEHLRTEKMLADPLTKRHFTQSVQRTRSRHGFKGKPLIPRQYIGPKVREFVSK